MFFLVLYALIGTLVTTVVFGKPLVRLNFEQLKKEANLRFSLVRIRENAEAIAFYRGEEQESNQVGHRFLDVFENVKRLLVWELNLNILTNADEFIPFAQFLEQTEATQASDEQQPRIQTIEADRLAVEHLSLQTPNYQRTLVEDLSVELSAGHGYRLLNRHVEPGAIASH